MKYLFLTILMLATSPLFAAEPPCPAKAAWNVDGHTYVIENRSLKNGVEVVIAFLRSCTSEAAKRGGSRYTKDDFRNALAGEHFHLVFAKPQMIEVMEKRVEVAELAHASGAIWVKSGDSVRRFSKYDFKSERAFDKWLREAEKRMPPGK